MREYKSTDFKLTFLEDAGYKDRKSSGRDRIGRFQCNKCFEELTMTYSSALANKTGMCVSCSPRRKNDINKGKQISLAEVREKFVYTEEGRLLRNGKEAGTVVKGYRIVCVNSIRYPVHRLIWLYTYGYFPSGDIDHIDHNKLNNRIGNLREVTKLGNMKSKRLYKKNTSGTHSVSWNSSNNNWRARIGVNGKQVEVGSFPTKDEAIKARKSAELEHGFHILHGSERVTN